VRTWDPAGQTLHTIAGHTSRVTVLAVAPDGSWLASASSDTTVRVWDAAAGTLRHALAGHASDVTALAVSPDGLQVASASRDGTVRIWDPMGGQASASLRVDGPLYAVASLGVHLIAGGAQGCYFWRYRGDCV
jgi:WD40 repeat protein